MEKRNDSEKLKKNLRILLLIIAILTIIVLIVLIAINNSKNNKTSEMAEQENSAESEELVENSITSNISKMSEEDRIESYIGEFISLIEEKNYSQAYNKLNANFKNNYFKTVEDFEKYAESKYPSNPNIEYSSIEKIGEIYLIQTKITDVIDSSFQEVSQKFVVRENGANDYTISFEAD